MVVIEGMNHVQIADGSLNNINWILRDNEIKSEISLEEAHTQIANIIKKFILAKNLKGNQSSNDINNMITDSFNN